MIGLSPVTSQWIDIATTGAAGLLVASVGVFGLLLLYRLLHFGLFFLGVLLQAAVHGKTPMESASDEYDLVLDQLFKASPSDVSVKSRIGESGFADAGLGNAGENAAHLIEPPILQFPGSRPTDRSDSSSNVRRKAA